MEPISLILLAALVLVYFVWYRSTFLLKPVRERKALVKKFETATNLNQQLLADLQQYATGNNLLDRTFIEDGTFRQKIAELEAARDDFFSEENYLSLRARHPRNLDLQLMSKTLDDQVIYHQRIKKALDQYKVGPDL